MIFTNFENQDSYFAIARILASADFSIEFDSRVRVSFIRTEPYLGMVEVILSEQLLA